MRHAGPSDCVNLSSSGCNECSAKKPVFVCTFLGSLETATCLQALSRWSPLKTGRTTCKFTSSARRETKKEDEKVFLPFATWKDSRCMDEIKISQVNFRLVSRRILDKLTRTKSWALPVDGRVLSAIVSQTIGKNKFSPYEHKCNVNQKKMSCFAHGRRCGCGLHGSFSTCQTAVNRELSL